MRKILFFLSVLAACGLSAQVVTDDNGKCGYLNAAGELIIPYSYDFIGDFNEDDVALVKVGKKWGMISRTGELKLPVKYDEIGLFSQGLAHIASGKKYGLVNTKGEITCKPQFQNIYRPNSDGIRIALQKKNIKAEKEFDGMSTYSIITKDGRMMFPANSGSAVGSFTLASLTATTIAQLKAGQDTLDTSLGYVCLNGLKNQQIFDLEGNVVFDDTRRDAILKEAFGDKAKVGNKNFYGPFTDFTPLEDVLRVIYNQKAQSSTLNVVYGYYDLKAQKLLKYYTSTSSKGTGLYSWNPDEEIGLLPFSDGFAVVNLKQNGNPRSEMLNRNGEVVATFPYGGCMSYQDGYAVASNANNKWGVIDLLQQPVVPFRYDEVSPRVNGKEDHLSLNAKEGNKWGVIDLQSNVIVPFDFDGLVTFEGSDAVFVVKGSKWGAFNGATEILACEYDSLRNFKDETFACFKKNKVSVYSVPLAKMSERYDGFMGVFDADKEYHNGTFWELYKITNTNDTVYGCLDGKTDVVVPFVLSNDASAHKAYQYFRNMPTQEFGELELYRLNLRFTVRERTYKLDAVIPSNHWDY